MSNVTKESEFVSFMHENGPPSDGGKRNYISWLRYIADNYGIVNESLTIDKIEDAYNQLKATQNSRDRYTSDAAVSDIKSSLNKYLAFINNLNPYSGTTLDIISIIDDQITTTQKREIEARIGQGKYRKELINIWGKCSLTKYSKVDFLVASHIKPWKSSTDQEKIDPYNGLLLIPNIDKLFDSGYITFTDDGNIITSNLITDNDLENMSISKNMKVFKIHKNNMPYLKYHRDTVFIK